MEIDICPRWILAKLRIQEPSRHHVALLVSARLPRFSCLRFRIQNLFDLFPEPAVCRAILHTLVPVQMGLARKRAQNMLLRGDGKHGHARLGTNRRYQLGSRAKCSRNKSSRYSHTFQRLLFDHELASRAGTRVGFAKATAHILGTG